MVSISDIKYGIDKIQNSAYSLAHNVQARLNESTFFYIFASSGRMKKLTKITTKIEKLVNCNLHIIIAKIQLCMHI